MAIRRNNPIDEMSEQELIDAIDEIVDYVFANLDRISIDRLIALSNKKSKLKRELKKRFGKEW